MENNTSAEKNIKQKIQIQDAYNDEHWMKKYGVSQDELKGTQNVGIPARIIEANSKNELLHV